ncbi:hypothetical protein [Bathymodiolus japonicus methanotrophic gill symbiont]|uniref:hypothetical protein n=1 Tax=Bathymodiolus japonicus methanotrophic gill symbiont TaxID=113269 RepID=UPI001C8F14C7|nr:hypothetical protein [Bathymodiolus japonicus methanotrophic gill symbiont]
MRSRCGRRAFRASPIRCVGERIMATGVPEFREVAWRASAAFLAKVNPEIILVPADSPNRFGFPHAEVVNRYKAIAAKYFISGESGAISVTISKNKSKLEGYRDKHSHYWNK